MICCVDPITITVDQGTQTKDVIIMDVPHTAQLGNFTLYLPDSEVSQDSPSNPDLDRKRRSQKANSVNEENSQGITTRNSCPNREMTEYIIVWTVTNL